MTLFVIFSLIFAVAVAILAPRFGTDTRDGRDWQPRRRDEPPW